MDYSEFTSTEYLPEKHISHYTTVQMHNTQKYSMYWTELGTTVTQKQTILTGDSVVGSSECCQCVHIPKKDLPIQTC